MGSKAALLPEKYRAAYLLRGTIMLQQQTYQTVNHLFCNAAAAKRILGLPASRKITIAATNEGATVTYADRKGEHTATITRCQFEYEFERVRREGAWECIARPVASTRYGDKYEVTGAKGDLYFVEVNSEAIACSCEDWHQHETICKHGYAVLSLYSIANLDVYFAARKLAAAYVADERRESAPLRSREQSARVRGISIE